MDIILMPFKFIMNHCIFRRNIYLIWPIIGETTARLHILSMRRSRLGSDCVCAKATLAQFSADFKQTVHWPGHIKKIWPTKSHTQPLSQFRKTKNERKKIHFKKC